MIRSLVAADDDESLSARAEAPAVIKKSRRDTVSSAPAERSGDSALDCCFKPNKESRSWSGLWKAASLLRSAAALQML